MSLWPFFCLALGAGAVILVSMDLDILAPALIPVIFGYAYTGMLDISKTVSYGRRAISLSESASLFRVSCRMWGPAVAVLVQLFTEILIIFIILPTLLGYEPFHAGSVSAICMMASVAHLWGFIHNSGMCGASGHTKF